MNSVELSFFNHDENRRWAAITGWLLPEAAEALFRHAGEASTDGEVVEIGSYAGKSTVCIARSLAARSGSSRMTAIDVGFQAEFEDSLRHFDVDDRVDRIENPSLDVAISWSRPISFLYIDALHDKAYAYADFLVWDLMVLPGSIVALDDTAGFMLGPSLQVQAGLQTGAYELVDDVGGVTFLRKKRPIVDGLSDFPLQRGSLLAYVQYLSAWLGALDPAMTVPRRRRSPRASGAGRLSKLASRLWLDSPSDNARVLMRRLRGGAKSGSGSGGGDLEKAMAVLPLLEAAKTGGAAIADTLAYLDASRQLVAGRHDRALDAFSALSGLDPSIEFFHFRVPIAHMAGLRVAQLHDMRGDRNLAIASYQRIVDETELPEIAAQATDGIRAPFQARQEPPRSMLREYNLDMARYRILE